MLFRSGSLAKRAGEEDAAPAPNFLKRPVEQIVSDGLRGLDRGRARTIPGLPLAVMMALTALVPIFLLRPFLGIGSRDARKK